MPFILATIHRAENTNDAHRLNTIFEQFEKLAREKVIVLPIHPRTRTFLERDFSSPNLRIIDPVGYFDMIMLQKHCRLIVTDSGGVQKEAYFNKKYCITVREETEWVELVTGGYNFLAQPITTLYSQVTDLWDKPFPVDDSNLYGDGTAANMIADILQQ